MDIFTAAARGNLDQIKARIAEDPGSVHLRFGQIRPRSPEPLDHDWMTPAAFAILNGRVEALEREVYTEGDAEDTAAR